MAGKLIVLEGTDGSGKSTQLQLLCRRLQRENKPFYQLVFPRYEEPSSTLVRMYLNGDFGANPSDVNAYAASTFYAVDRYASYQMEWKRIYESGGLLISDRYTTSNAIHQAAKLPKEQRTSFFQWLFDFEYHKLGLPRPDLVLFLDMPTDRATQLLRGREGETGTKGDIHEINMTYLSLCREAAYEAAQYGGWHRISCVHQNKIRTPEDIGEEIYHMIF
ncbi:MAG: dTMP kinase [Oscillospiraceae bacterium]|jgi:dTMP kinase